MKNHYEYDYKDNYKDEGSDGDNEIGMKIMIIMLILITNERETI